MAKDSEGKDRTEAPEDNDPLADETSPVVADESGNGESAGPDGTGTRATPQRGGEADGEVDASSEQAPAQRGPATARTGGGSDDDLTEDEVAAILAGMPVGTRNRFVPGTLTVHYTSRSVDYPADGAAAMRLLAALAGTSRDMDHVVPDRSDARHGWMMVDRDHVIGAYWTPSESTVPRRVTMDPVGELVDAS